MKKKDIICGEVVGSRFPNIGIVETGEGLIRVKNTLPGQEIEARVQKVRKGKCEGVLTNIIKRSPLETEENICIHFRECGSCLYSSIPYSQELIIKENQVRDLLAPVIGEDSYSRIYNGIEASPGESAYRNKMEFSFGDEYKGGPLALGMHKRGAYYDIITTAECHLVDSDFGSILSATLAYFKEKNIPHYNKNTREGYLRHLLIRKGIITGEVICDLVTTENIDENIVKGWCNRILELSLNSKIAGILHTNNNRIGDVVENQGTVCLYGEEFFTENLLGLSFKITPFSFFQTNSLGAEKLYEIIRNLTPKTGIVYDLYCGTGTISQILAGNAREVIGVEIIQEAVEAAVENAKINNIDNVKFIAGDVLKVLDNIEEPPDMIILDPPREGVNPKALKKILSYGVDSIIYVSCKPTSLARDMTEFINNGYKPVYIKLVDMFARTGNVETVCLLSNRKPDTKVRIDVDLEDYYHIKDSKENQN